MRPLIADGLDKPHHKRRYHTDEDCRAVKQIGTLRHATDGEIERYQQCAYCADDERDDGTAHEREFEADLDGEEIAPHVSTLDNMSLSNRVYHTDTACVAFRQIDDARPATDREIEHGTECRFCSGERVTVRNAVLDYDIPELNRRADEADGETAD
jgi:hypothetical protein